MTGQKWPPSPDLSGWDSLRGPVGWAYAVDCRNCGTWLPEPVDYGDQAPQVCEQCGAEQ